MKTFTAYLCGTCGDGHKNTIFIKGDLPWHDAWVAAYRAQSAAQWMPNQKCDECPLILVVFTAYVVDSDGTKYSNVYDAH